MPEYQTFSTGTLSDANTSDDITTLESGALCFISISLSDLQNGDNFNLQLQSYDLAIFVDYINYQVTMAGGAISFNTGAGAAISYTTELSFENIYLDLTHPLRLFLTRTSANPRNFAYYYNTLE